jgi:chromosome segregation ATPase
MVFAALTNTPCVAICYHDKMREFAREMGWEDRCFDISRFDAAQVASRLREVVSEWPRLGEECKARLEALKQRALRNAEIVTEVLNLWGKSPLRRGGKPVNQDAVDAASWQRRLAEVEKYADGLEAVLDAKDERIAALETTQRELQAARAELQAARAELQAARAEVQASHREADRLREELAVWSTWGTRVQRSLPYRAFRLLKRACRLGRSSP